MIFSERLAVLLVTLIRSFFSFDILFDVSFDVAVYAYGNNDITDFIYMDSSEPVAHVLRWFSNVLKYFSTVLSGWVIAP